MSDGILIIDDEAVLAKNIKRHLERHDYEARIAPSAKEGLRQFEEFKPDLVLLDFNLPDADGLEVLKQLRNIDPLVPIVLITGHGDIQLAVRAMKAGAYDYLTKPLVLSELARLVDEATAHERLEGALSYYRDREAVESGLDKILGESVPIRTLRQRIRNILDAERQLSDDDLPAILISGETGTGKELVARALHYDGRRGKSPFVEINCASIPTSLVESELFGYERGAFTDARGRKLGLSEAADGGTIFLDEIGELDPSVQAKLLRLLENRTVRRIGGLRDRKVNIRIVAATNRPLEDLVKQGKFRSDLYYRLSVVTLGVPPLRDRGEDILHLADHFLRLHGRRYKKHELAFSDAARRAILTHRWPGNVRELRNVVEQATLMASGSTIDVDSLPFHPYITVSSASDQSGLESNLLNLLRGRALTIEDIERALIRRALYESAGNISKAAQIIGLSRDSLRYRMDKYEIVRPGRR